MEPDVTCNEAVDKDLSFFVYKKKMQWEKIDSW